MLFFATYNILDCLMFHQLWEIDDIERKDDSRNIILNYHGLLFQRFGEF